MKENYSLTEIQKNAELLDSEALHLYLLSKVESGEFASCYEALAAYVEENDIDLDDKNVVKKYISPSLQGIIYKEAIERSMLKDKPTAMSISDFF